MMNAISTSSKTMTFGDVLLEEREKLGLSHRAVAQRVGTDRITVRKWEEDEDRPNAFQAKKLFGTFARLRHYVHLLHSQVSRDRIREVAVAEKEPLPEQLPAPAIVREEVASSFGEALRRARVHEGLTQMDVADLLGVANSVVSSWERGAYQPVLTNYAVLLDVFPGLAHEARPKCHRGEKPSGGWKARRDEALVGVVREEAEIAASIDRMTPQIELIIDAGLDAVGRSVAAVHEGMHLESILESTLEVQEDLMTVNLVESAKSEVIQPVRGAPAAIAKERSAALRWGRALLRIKPEERPRLVELLTVASDAGFSLEDVIASFADES